jgi:hypothetical protein
VGDEAKQAVQWLERNYDSTMALYVYQSDEYDGLNFIRAHAGDYGIGCYARPMFEIKSQQ